MESSGPRHVLFVVGMHRSGTSAACAALSACGVDFGEQLIAPMAGVNDAGFWEAETVVAINEQLLQAAGRNWYSLNRDQLPIDWSGPTYGQLRAKMADFLNGLGRPGALSGIKDPRFCITLPVWLEVARELGFNTSLCVVLRNPHNVALSLQSRDGFPLGYGLHLLCAYLEALSAEISEDTLFVEYEALLENPLVQMQQASKHLPLVVQPELLEEAVKIELQRESGASTENALAGWRGARDGIQSLSAAVEDQHPIAAVAAALVEVVVHRGQELQRIGEAHSDALATIQAKDADIERLGGELRDLHDKHRDLHGDYAEAQAVIAERTRWMQLFKAAQFRWNQWRKSQ